MADITKPGDGKTWEWVRTCDVCRVNPADNRYREVTGWEEIRRGGGANKIMFRQDTGRRACTACIKRREYGVDQGQEAMW